MKCVRTTIRPQILPVTVYLFAGDIPFLKTTLKDSIFRDVDPKELDDSSALALSNGGHLGVAFNTGYLSHRVIGHELLHLTINIWHYLGHVPKLTPGETEPYSYVTGFLHGWCYQQLLKSGLKIESTLR